MIQEILTASGLSTAAFLTTNGDNLFLLLAFMADRNFSRLQVLGGYALGMAALLAMCVGLSLLSHVIPGEHLGWLGFVPLGLGLVRGVQVLRDPGGYAAEVNTHAKPARGGWANVAIVGAVEVANGTDTLAIYGPLMAESGHRSTVAMAATFGLLTGVWCLLAYWLTSHPRFTARMHKWGYFLTPFAMIGLGIYILFNTITDLIEDQPAVAF